MTRKLWFCLVLMLAAVPPLVHASEALNACAAAQAPFDTLAQLVFDPAVDAPPQVQLCHRVANAAKHFKLTRKDKAIDELRKFINDTRRSTPSHLDVTYAEALAAEAERLIALLDGSGGPILGQVSGGVFALSDKSPVANATVTLNFLSGTQPISTTTDTNGLFLFPDLQPAGTFVVTADNGAGATGAVQGSLLETELTTSVTVLVDVPGTGLINGQVTSSAAEPAAGVLVLALFPDSGREYTTTSGSDGRYAFNAIHADGTVILIAFDNASGATGSYSSVITPSSPSRTVDLQLAAPAVVNPELTNAGFTDGLTGWTSQGPVMVIDRDVVFGAQN